VSAVEGGRAASLKPVQRQLLQWILKLDEAIEAEQGRVWRAEPGPDRQLYGPLLVLLKSDKLAVIVVHEVVNLCLRHGNGGVPAANLCLHISESMQAEVNILRLQRRFGREVMSKLQNSGRRHVRDVNIRAKRALDVLDVADWPVSLRVKVGAVLVRMLMDVAVDEATEVPVFCHEMRWKGGKRRMRSTGILLMDDDVYERMLLQEDICRLAMPRYLPMLVAPRPWIRHNSGAYFRLKSQVMRTHGITSQIQALRRADLSRVYHGLNCLGRVPWRIHGELLDLIQEAWQRGLNVGDLPKLQDIPLAPPPQPGPREEDEEEAAARRRAHAATVRRTKRLNADLHSLRSDLRIKLTIADDFRDKEIYFPYNLDFRGRVYPVPPNLNHMGNDASRAVLRFSQELPLGERGWYWLRVHCANLYGEDKVSFDDRVSFTDRHMSDILDSAAAPLEGGMWWSKADYPWQCLAACIDIAAAIRGGDPTSHKSSLPIHQDGSCNGLQHYAALSRDAAGGHSVNLTPSRQPQDVYSGVSQRVAELVAEEARKVLPSTASKSERTAQKCALLLDGLIDRKVVKQTVMTSVYGVTFVGARRQIQARLEDKLTKVSECPFFGACLDKDRRS
jgi:DNA-directed RNA polymerase